MPAALWTAAIALARQHGLYTTARALHLDYGSLKKRRDAAGAAGGAAPAFVELLAARPTGLGPCIIDLDVPPGGRMRMPCLAGLAGQNLAEQGFAADRLQRPLLRRSRFVSFR